MENTQTTNIHYQWCVHPWHSSHIVWKWYGDNLHPIATTQYHNHCTPKNNISKLQNEPLRGTKIVQLEQKLFFSSPARPPQLRHTLSGGMALVSVGQTESSGRTGCRPLPSPREELRIVQTPLEPQKRRSWANMEQEWQSADKEVRIDLVIYGWRSSIRPVWIAVWLVCIFHLSCTRGSEVFQATAC